MSEDRRIALEFWLYLERLKDGEPPAILEILLTSGAKVKVEVIKNEPHLKLVPPQDD